MVRLAHRDDDEPGTAARRYELITGGPEGRATIYAARKVLGFSHAEWAALPWHDQRLYAEGMATESGHPGRQPEPPAPPRSSGHPHHPASPSHDPDPVGVPAPVPPAEPGRPAGGGAADHVEHDDGPRMVRAVDGTRIRADGPRLSGLRLPVRQAAAPPVVIAPPPE